MINKELRKLSRRELVDIIYQLKKNEQQLQEEVASLRQALQEKRIRIAEAGSIAEAAVSITDLLATAQATADLYLQEIASLKEETEKECARRISEVSISAETKKTIPNGDVAQNEGNGKECIDPFSGGNTA